MSSIDQQFVEFIVKSLVGNPEAVQVERRIDEKGVLLELTVDPEDLGRVIGKRGATAQSLRTLLRALGTKNDARYNLKIVDNGQAGSGSGFASDASDGADDTGFSSSASQPQTDDTQQSNDFADDDQTSQPVSRFGDDDGNSGKDSGNDSQNNVVTKTRKELAELDDLDV